LPDHLNPKFASLFHVIPAFAGATDYEATFASAALGAAVRFPQP